MSETHNLSTWKTKFEQAERELSTWKTRAEKAEAILERLEVTDFIQLLFERDTLKARCEKLEGYVVHICGCPLNAKSESYGQSKFCTCGLDELRKQVEASFELPPAL